MAGKTDILRIANKILRDQDHDSIDRVQLDAIFRAIYELVRDGNNTVISHFGSFVRMQRAARKVWDYSKGAHRAVPAVAKLMFRTKVRFEEKKR